MEALTFSLSFPPSPTLCTTFPFPPRQRAADIAKRAAAGQACQVHVCPLTPQLIQVVGLVNPSSRSLGLLVLYGLLVLSGILIAVAVAAASAAARWRLMFVDSGGSVPLAGVECSGKSCWRDCALLDLPPRGRFAGCALGVPRLCLGRVPGQSFHLRTATLACPAPCPSLSEDLRCTCVSRAELAEPCRRSPMPWRARSSIQSFTRARFRTRSSTSSVSGPACVGAHLLQVSWWAVRAQGVVVGGTGAASLLSSFEVVSRQAASPLQIS